MEKKYGKHDQINTRTNQKIRGWRGIAIIPVKISEFNEDDEEEIDPLEV